MTKVRNGVTFLIRFCPFSGVYVRRARSDGGVGSLSAVEFWLEGESEGIRGGGGGGGVGAM